MSHCIKDSLRYRCVYDISYVYEVLYTITQRGDYYTKNKLRCIIISILTLLLFSNSAYSASPLLTPGSIGGISVQSPMPGCSIGATSYYILNNPSVDPTLAFDGDPTTGWDSWGEHEGTWISTTFSTLRNISGFSIINGKPERFGSREYYYRNSRVKLLNVYIDSQFIGSYYIQDNWVVQYFSFGNTINGSSVLFEVAIIYQGSSYFDSRFGVCISEISM